MRNRSLEATRSSWVEADLSTLADVGRRLEAVGVEPRIASQTTFETSGGGLSVEATDVVASMPRPA